MTTRNAHVDPKSAMPAGRSPWRIDPPAPTGLQDLMVGAWPGALVAMVLLGLLLAFGSVVRDGVRRGDQLRSQLSSAVWQCDALAPQTQAVACADIDALARSGSAQMPVAAEVTATRTLIRQP